MFILGHISFPSLIFIAIAEIFRIEYTSLHIILLTIFSVLPDIDMIYLFIKSRRQNRVLSHHDFFTHWPIIYLPFLLLLILHHNIYTIIMAFGVYSHLIMDTFASGKGIKWAFPLSRRYYNFFASKTAGKENTLWLKTYRSTTFFKMEIVGFLLLVYILLFVHA